MKIRIIRVFFSSLAIAAVLGFYACSDKDDGVKPSKGKVNFYFTDAPLDATNISGVHITITGVDVNGPNGWQTISGFKKKTLNVLDFQSGLNTLLSSAELDTGKYTEVRLILDAAEEGKEKTNQGCFIKFKDNTSVGLFVPSGQQTGYKLKGEFEVKGGKEVSVTIDFDARKSVHRTGNGKYMLKPVVRMVVNTEVGAFQGTFPNISAFDKVTIFAYKAGTFTPDEINASEFNPAFVNATNGGTVDSNGSYKIAFLPEGTYDLYAAAFLSDGNVVGVIGSKLNVHVANNQTVSVSF